MTIVDARWNPIEASGAGDGGGPVGVQAGLAAPAEHMPPMIAEMPPEERQLELKEPEPDHVYEQVMDDEPTMVTPRGSERGSESQAGAEEAEPEARTAA